ncbi:MAG: TrbI/VirB10 family protein [Bdellovibrionales bacterium]
MSEKEGVEFSQYGAGKKAIHESLKYIRDQERIKPWAKGFGLALLALSVGIVLLKEDPRPDLAPGASAIPTPDMDGDQPRIDLKAYNRGEDATRKPKGQERRSRPVEIRLSGPKLIPRSSKVEIPPGTEALAVLVTGASNGLVKVKLKEDVASAGEVFLHAGTILVGQGASTDERLFVRFTKAVAADGTVSTITAEIADAKDKTAGLKGSFWKRHGGRIAAGAGLNFIAGASEAFKDTRGEQGVVVTKPTVRNAILGGTARAALEESSQIASKYKNAPPSIKIRAGVEVAIIFTDGSGG